MILKLATGHEIEYIRDAGIGAITAHYDTAEEAAADIELFTPEALKVVQIIDGEEVIGTYTDLVFEGADIELADLGVYCTFKLRELNDIERQLQEVMSRVDALETKVDALDDEVFGDVTIIFDLVDSRPTNIYRSTATPLTGDETTPVATFDFGTGQAGTYTFTFKRHELPSRFCITKANNAYSLAISGEYLEIQIEDGVTEYHYSNVNAINTR